jgi:hypothetical protein
VTSTVEARQLMHGEGGFNNVTSNENLVQDSSKRHYRDKLVDILIDIQAILSRAAVAFEVSSLTLSMVDRTRVRASRMMTKKDPPLLMPRT